MRKTIIVPSLAALALVAVAPVEAAEVDQIRRFTTGVGSCRVTVLAPALREGAGTTNAFLVERRSDRILIAPFPGAEEAAFRASAKPRKDVKRDIVLLTVVDARQVGGSLLAGDGNRGASDVFVDERLLASVLETPEGKEEVLGLLAAERSRGRLRTAPANVDILPGVRITIPTRRPEERSRIRVACGTSTLLVLDEADLPVGSGGSVKDAEVLEAARGLPAGVASDRYALATITGSFPALGHLYRLRDGDHWGSIQASMVGGVPRPRGRVIVETGPVPQAREGEPGSRTLPPPSSATGERPE